MLKSYIIEYEAQYFKIIIILLIAIILIQNVSNINMILDNTYQYAPFETTGNY